MSKRRITVAVIWHDEVAVYPLEEMQEFFKNIPSRGRYFLAVEGKHCSVYKKSRGKFIRLSKERIPSAGEHPENYCCEFFIFDRNKILDHNALITWMIKTIQNNMRAVLGSGNRRK
jgi:hypothetical protein